MPFFKLTRFWKKSGIEKNQGELFKHEHRRKFVVWIWLPIALLLLLLVFSGGYIIGKKSGVAFIKRKAVIYPFGKARKQKGYLDRLSEGRLYFPKGGEEEAYYAPFAEEEDYIELDRVRRIDFLPPEKKKNTPPRKLRSDEKNFLGRYRIQVSRHRGLFYIYHKRKGGLGASVRFTNWGNQEMEFLYRVRVWKNKIYFRRSCRGRRCAEIGSSRALNQKFVGNLSANKGKKITGTYTGGQSGSAWSAVPY